MKNKCKRGEIGLFVKDQLKEHRYVNTGEFKAVECVKIDAHGASPAYWSVRGILKNKNEAIRLGKYRFEKQAVEALEILVARLNREYRTGGMNIENGIQSFDDER